MKWFKWVLFGILTAGIGFWIYKLCKRDSETNLSLDSFAEGYTNGFSAISSPTAPKKYGQITQEIQQKQIQAYKQINANHKEQRTKLKTLTNE
ncbi:hypothetical protein [Helicobacter apodemus]|uniref:Uncharacterized protein n=1 Tax=Helicobacter apodemus TaxID=135569 RepID=A0A2U8FCC6_9HELI|nr:hypothetical protein [Helicobacter apodemus]AWI33796.1 hypothetical protein CDV25_02735 [Helicobacter apodemus]